MLNISLGKGKFEGLLVDHDRFPIKVEAANPFMISQEFDFLSEERSYKSIKQVSKPDKYIEIFRNKQIQSASIRLNRMPNNVQLLNNLGVSYLNSGKFDTAIDCFKEVLRINNKFFPSLANLARTYFQRGEIDEALSIYLNIEEREPKNIKVLNNIANLLIAKKDLKLAYEYLDRVIKVDERNLAALHNIATILLLENKIEKAISFYRRAINIRSDLPGALNNLGVCFAIKKSYKKAIKHFWAAWSLNKQSVGYLLNLANVYQELGSHDHAIRVLEDYLGRGYDNLDVRNALAWSYASTKSYQNCLKHLNSALKMAEYNNEKQATILNNLAIVFECMGNYEIAEKYYNLCLEKKPSSSPIPLRNTIEFYFVGNRDELARKLIDQGLVDFPNDHYFLYCLGRYYFEVNNHEKASEIYNEVIRIAPTISNSYAALSVIEIEINNDLKKAHEILTKGLALYPDSLGLLNNLAYCYLMRNEPHEARQILDKIKTQDNVFLTATRGLLLLKENNILEGQRLYNLAISLASKDENITRLLKQKKHLELAKYYHKEGNISEAMRLSKKVLSIEAKYTYYRNQAKELLQVLGNLREK
jgi:tetratricopeptide (TPR) repeat protein